jgi:threonine dehydrogenase-like Zn-dependent dehydrogenase
MKVNARRQTGQVLVFFALALPLVLLPVAAYAVDAAVSGTTFARLQEVTATAAEEAAQQVDIIRLRAGAGLAIDAVAAASTVHDVVASADPNAKVVDVAIAGTTVTVKTEEVVALPLVFIGAAAITIHASAWALLAGGYDSPSSLLPLPLNTF